MKTAVYTIMLIRMQAMGKSYSVYNMYDNIPGDQCMSRTVRALPSEALKIGRKKIKDSSCIYTRM